MLTNPIYNKKIRLHIIWGLVFSFLVAGCFEKEKKDHLVSIEWEGRKAKGLVIPLKLLPGISYDSIEQLVHIQLTNSNTPILGEYKMIENVLIFRPLIPFTRGLKYEVRLQGKVISEIEILSGDTHDAPEVISIYPTSDTVPLNLLKIYIAFSKPMQEGQSLNNIAVIKNGKDTVPSVFLDLQAELWNKERTILTLWLDPGRIKRDLQPNKKMGLLLELGSGYQIVVRQNWRDTEGDSLAIAWHKDFVVGLRDSLSPAPGLWTIHPPKARSSEPLKIDLHEPLDYLLLKNAVRVIDSKGNIINGVIETEAKERILSFVPSVTWNPGDYTLEIESRLEDLAGNNLNRLFDKDITRKSTGVPKEVYKRSFHIE
jgi:hypothetical protein